MLIPPSGLTIVAGLYPFVSFTPLTIFFAYFLIRFVKSRQKMFLHLAFLFVITIINQGCLMLMVVVNSTVLARVLFIAAQALEVMGMLVMVIVLESYEENKPYSPRVAGFMAFAAAIIGAMVSSPQLETLPFESAIGSGHLVYFARLNVTGILLGTLPLLVAIWVVVSFFTKRKLARSKEQQRVLFLLYFGIFLSQLGGSFTPTIVQSVDIHFLDVASNIGIMRVIGIVIIGFAFLHVSKKPWLLQLQRIHVLLVYAKSGITLYSKRFREDISQTDVELLAGAITAVASLFRESTKETSPIETIKFKGKSVRVIDRGAFTCSVMVDYASQASDSAHKLFVQEFETTFAAEIAGFVGETSKFSKAEDIAAKYFA